MKSRNLIPASALAVTAVCFSPLTMAEPETGDREFTLAGSGTSDNGFDNTSFGLDASIGWFTTEHVEWGIRQNLGISDTEEDTDISGGTRVFLDYHFDYAQWQPFLGGSFGMVYGDNVSNSFSIGPEGGIKYYIKPKTFILVSATYQFNVDEDADDGSTFYTAGLGINF